MAKTITMSYDGKEYTLEFTRRSIMQMEKDGFVASDIQDKPMSSLPALFAGAFIAHHRLAPKATIEAMFDRIPKKSEFLGKLAEMYAEGYESLMAEPEESEGNASWVTNW